MRVLFPRAEFRSYNNFHNNFEVNLSVSTILLVTDITVTPIGAVVSIS